jgi:hypothetical protein
VLLKCVELQSSIIFLTPSTHSASIRTIFDSIIGIRSVSKIPIKIVAPLQRSMAIWHGLRADIFTDVDFIETEPSGKQADMPITSAVLLSMVQRVKTDISVAASGNFYVFVGVETYADAFTECTFALKRRLGAASVFALDTRCENPAACPVDSEWSTEHSLASRTTLLTFDPRVEARSADRTPIKVLRDPRLGNVSVAARQRARRKMNVSDGDFALSVISDEFSVTDAARVAWQSALILALMQAPNSRLLIAGSRDKVIAPWLEDLSATFPGRIRFVGTCPDDARGINAADLLLIPRGVLGISTSLCCVDYVTGPETVETEHEHQIVMIEEGANTDAVDDFVHAVSLLPLLACGGIELLRDSFVLSMRERMSLGFGRGLYYAMTLAR